MASGRIIFPGFMPCEDSNGDRISGAKAYFYLNLTSTLTTVYSDSALTIELTNPVVADADGVWPAMWADTALLFTVSLTNGSGVPLSGATWSGVGPAIDGTLASAALAASSLIATLVAQAAAEAALASTEDVLDQVEAIAADLSGEPFMASSVTSMTIGAGTKSFNLSETGKLFNDGQTVVIARPSPNAGTQMTGVCQSLTGVAMVVDVSSVIGAGTFTDWRISLSGVSGGVTSVAGLTGAVTAAAAKTALAIASTDITNFNAAVDARAIAFAVAL